MGCGSRVTTWAEALMGKVALVWKEDTMARAWRARGERQEGAGETAADTDLEGLGGIDKHGGFTLSGMGCH